MQIVSYFLCMKNKAILMNSIEPLLDTITQTMLLINIQSISGKFHNSKRINISINAGVKRKKLDEGTKICVRDYQVNALHV